MLQIMFENARITMLKALHKQPSYRLNTSVLKDVVNGYGITLGRDQIMTNISWLERQGLVATEEIGGGSITLVTLTGAGQDVAEGTVFIKGVKRPSATGGV